MITEQEILDKIDKVKFDLSELKNNGGGDRAVTALNDYISYLEDELKMVRDANRTRTGVSK
jgi:hypothetical protein